MSPRSNFSPGRRIICCGRWFTRACAKTSRLLRSADPCQNGCNENTKALVGARPRRVSQPRPRRQDVSRIATCPRNTSFMSASRACPKGTGRHQPAPDGGSQRRCAPNRGREYMDIWFAITALLDRPRRQPGPARIGLIANSTPSTRSFGTWVRCRRRSAGFGVKVLDLTVT